MRIRDADAYGKLYIVPITRGNAALYFENNAAIIVARNRVVLFRARFAARHVSRLGRLIFALLRRVSLAYRQVSGVPHGAKSSKIARPILRGSVKPIGS